MNHASIRRDLPDDRCLASRHPGFTDGRSQIAARLVDGHERAALKHASFDVGQCLPRQGVGPLVVTFVRLLGFCGDKLRARISGRNPSIWLVTPNRRSTTTHTRFMLHCSVRVAVRARGGFRLTTQSDGAFQGVRAALVEQHRPALDRAATHAEFGRDFAEGAADSERGQGGERRSSIRARFDT